MQQYINTTRFYARRTARFIRTAFHSNNYQHHQETPAQYFLNKKQWGSFWGLYLIGINHASDIKYTLTKLLVGLVLQYILTCCTNFITLNIAELDKDIIIEVSAIICIIKILQDVKGQLFNAKVICEELLISKKIGSYAKAVYKRAPYSWKGKNTSVSRQHSIDAIYNTYSHITTSTTRMIQSVIDGSVILVVAFNNDWFIGLTILIGSFVLFKTKCKLNVELNKLDKTMGDKMDDSSIDCSNKYTNMNDIEYNSSYSLILREDQYDYVDGLEKSYKNWDERNLLSQKSTAVINTMSIIIIFVISAYLCWIEKKVLIIFVLMQGANLFGLVNVLTQADDIKNIGASRLASTFKMLDGLGKVNDDKGYDFIEYESDKVVVLSNPRTMVVHNICAKIDNNLYLRYNGTITFDLTSETKRRITLLNGPKGCGKSLTFGYVAGLYDGQITDGVWVDGVKMLDEFRGFSKNRSYIRQLVVDDYKSNRKSSVCMSLEELFPDASYAEIKEYLNHFDLAHKMPLTMVEAISKNERGLSPGETQGLVVASQLWKSSKLSVSLLMLDEPERNMDLNTVKKMFHKILDMFDCNIMLITHLPDLKIYLDDYIKEEWKFADNTGGDLSFVVESRV